ncbi:apolipoprotein N-acyltransferase [Granulosicoccus antarcticus]|uniref:Apolipoprotein N-acyltransferase n=1 Tax=Granulosicoccus antarcticus IMCC3135 TaxID=1192854 RepID=A0A2Z2NQA2_9GAMM|nr:apolipoprotein N-acyltransferase [Granulosicoccus antarcticus]ASJ72151.1 Apolipoprotein N-acyltransferase [Granulosicoccus antarcticus IMCC3135]
MPVLPRWIASTLAVCSGLILPLSFAPTHWWLLAILTVMTLYGLIQQATPRQALWLGWLFGLGYFGIGVHWVYFSLHLFGAAIAPLAALLTLVFVLVMTVFPALSCWLWARFRLADASLRNALLFASIWVLSELLRGKLMDGFPWILIGYSQTSGPLGDFAPLVGVYGISFLVVLLATMLLVVLAGSWKQRAGAITSISAVALVAWVAGTLSFSAPAGDPLTVRLVQANIAQEMKFSPERLNHALKLYASMTSQDGLKDVDLVVWPETAIPTYFDRVESAMSPFIASMEARGVDVLSGGFQRDGDDVYNAVRQLGGERAVYRKRHLVPFGEYMPLRFVLDFAARFIDIPMSDLAAGRGPYVPIKLQGTSVGVSICYEDVYGEEMRALLPESQMMVNVSNDAWFGDSAAPRQHEQKARMRAREFARPLVRVTNTGISSAMDFKGNILGRIEHDTQGILDVQIQPRSGMTPYARTGNWPVFILALILCLGIAWARRLRA